MALTPEQVKRFEEAIAAFYENDDEARLMDIFKIFDRDGNGRIDANELKTVMSSITHSKVSDEEVESMIKEADVNGDGVIDPSEFVRIMKKNK